MIVIVILDLALALFACHLSCLWFIRRFKAKYAYLPLPPGPRGWPLIGNLLDMPGPATSSKVFHKWCKELDTGFIHLNVAGRSMIVLDTYEDCIELLERRSSRYSGRMRLPMINELMGYDFHFATMDYGDKWRQRRRLMHNSFHPTAVKSFRPLQLKAARKFASELSTSTDMVPALKQMMGGTMITIAYGFDIQKKDDPYIKAAEEGVKIVDSVQYPGAFLVDVLPILKYVPEWMPGASFKRKAREWRAVTEKMAHMPFEACILEIERGTAKPSFAYNGLQNAATKGGIYTEENVRSVSASLYIAGTDTTVATIGVAIFMLLDYPDIMKKIQAEIDSVTNGTRLPDFGDQPHVPYLAAYIKEIMRYWTLMPLSGPHHLAVDDEYKGYRIPPDSYIIPNSWAICHNGAVFVDPFTLNPDRFLSGSDDELKLRNAHYNIAWGYGRRVCPGRHLASATIWITLAHILAIYDISKMKDEDGNIIEPSHEPAKSGLMITPPEYQCSFTLRSKTSEALLLQLGEME